MTDTNQTVQDTTTPDANTEVAATTEETPVVPQEGAATEAKVEETKAE